MNDGTYAAVGIHFRPHLSAVGGADIKTLPRVSRKEGTGPVGAHMCMYFGDSRNKLNRKADPNHKYNQAAKKAFSIAQERAAEQERRKLALVNAIVTKTVGVIKHTITTIHSFLRNGK